MSYESTYATIKAIYDKLNEHNVGAYMIGGISSALLANIDLYRQNDDIDLMVDIEDLNEIIKCLSEIGYSVNDKRGSLTENYVDENNTFYPKNHELDCDIQNEDMLGVGIFTFERKDGSVITNSYAYNEKDACIIGNRKVMPEELFDLMYSSEEIEYKGNKIKCQSKEFTYLSKSQGNREKDKKDASVIEKYIGKDEQLRIARIKKLQKRVENYRVTYGKDGEILSIEKQPSLEEKIGQFIANIEKSGMSAEELKSAILSNEQVIKLMRSDTDIKNIMEIWENTEFENNGAEVAKQIAHSYYYDDLQEQDGKLLLEKKKISTLAKQQDVAMKKDTVRECFSQLLIDEKEQMKEDQVVE